MRQHPHTASAPATGPWLRTHRAGVQLSGILLLALLVRLVNIDFPVGGFAAWRQADTAAMARNFLENGYTFLYPQIDWGGNSPGYVETEFPLYPFVVALLYAVAGPADAIGRLVSVACSIVTIFALFSLVRRVLDERTALWSAGLYAFLPLNIFYGRAFMPEPMMLMSSVIGIACFVAWVQERRMRHLLWSALFVALAALLKIPTLYLGIPLLFLSWTACGRRFLLEWRLWLFAACVLLPVALWYAHAHGIYLQSGLTFGIWMFGTNKWGMVGPLLTVKFYNDVFFKSIAERHLTYAAFIPVVAGLFMQRTRPLERLFDWWLVGLLVYVALVPLGHQIHEYYQLPFTIPACVFGGKFLHALFTRSTPSRRGRVLRLAGGMLILAGIGVLSTLRVAHFMRNERLDNPILAVGRAVQELTTRDELAVAVSEGDPIYFYAAHRKGWHASPSSLTDSFLRECTSGGATIVFGDVAVFERAGRMEDLRRLTETNIPLAATGEYFVLRLNPDREP